MNKNVLLISMILLALTANAQRNAEPMHDRQLERMKAELSLSDEQVSKLAEVNKKFRSDMMSLRSDTTLTREKLMREQKRHGEEREESVKRILTKDQYRRWMSGKPSQQGGPRPRMNGIGSLKEEVGLTDEQARKVMAINASMVEEFRALRADSTLSRESRQKAIKSLTDERNAKVEKILTEEQYKKFLAYEEKRTAGRRRGAPGPVR